MQHRGTEMIRIGSGIVEQIAEMLQRGPLVESERLLRAVELEPQGVGAVCKERRRVR
ncbi:MAG: hypothetical protein JWN53_1831 [Gemmatimonadetes bacterium]|nr:hypothetical protein [Gemmatimonadota bacterium]